MLRHFHACFLFLLVGCMLLPYCVAKATYEALGSAIDRILDRLESLAMNRYDWLTTLFCVALVSAFALGIGKLISEGAKRQSEISGEANTLSGSYALYGHKVNPDGTLTATRRDGSVILIHPPFTLIEYK